jgi:hypothetical protein
MLTDLMDKALEISHIKKIVPKYYTPEYSDIHITFSILQKQYSATVSDRILQI